MAAPQAESGSVDGRPERLSRRELLRRSAGAAAGVAWATARRPCGAAESAPGTLLNDVQSRLNPTRVDEVLSPETVDALRVALENARQSARAISMAGGRHSMGGQQFGAGNLHLDMTALSRVHSLDTQRGLVTVGAGIQWPALLQALHERQAGDPQPWTIREKQTGVDAVTLGGALSSNIHGRSLAHPPFVSDIESFQLLDPTGELRNCSREETPELFSLAIGGYGLFGLVTTIALRLVRRFKIRRRVEVIEVAELIDRYRARLDEGFVFGDCQYSPDLSGAAQQHQGVFPCYEPIDIATPIGPHRRELTPEAWAKLYKLIRTDKKAAFEVYQRHYRTTDGQVYWSDTHQMAGAFVGHRTAVDPKRGTEMITEVYLPHNRVLPFFAKIRDDLARRAADITYGTIRFIEADRETFLPWARQRSVCVICNLHVQHSREGIAKAKSDFRQIIDRVIEFDGSFYLTYHRWATPEQVAACHPRIRRFFEKKRKYDPEERFQSDWYRHYAPMLS